MSEAIGKFEIRQKLVVTQASENFIGYNLFEQRTVLIKYMLARVFQHPDHGRSLLHQFINQATYQAQVNHPHICRVYEATARSNRAYVATEYVAHGSLADMLAKAPEQQLSLHKKLEIIFKCARALDYAYSKNLAHRNLKPSNILLCDEEGRDIKLSDFGQSFVSLMSRDKNEQQYASPQALRGEAPHITDDIYSLGCITRELVKDELTTLAAQNSGQQTASKSKSRSKAEYSLLAELIAKSTHAEHELRYTDFNEFSQALVAVLRSAPKSVQTNNPLAIPVRFELLRSMRFFSNFDDTGLWEILRISQWEICRKNTQIAKQGNKPDEFIFIASGATRLEHNGQLIEELHPGDCAGEIALFAKDNPVRLASIISTTRVCIFRIRFLGISHASDRCQQAFYRAFLEVAANRLNPPARPAVVSEQE